MALVDRQPGRSGRVFGVLAPLLLEDHDRQAMVGMPLGRADCLPACPARGIVFLARGDDVRTFILDIDVQTFGAVAVAPDDDSPVGDRLEHGRGRFRGRRSFRPEPRPVQTSAAASVP